MKYFAAKAGNWLCLYKQADVKKRKGLWSESNTLFEGKKSTLRPDNSLGGLVMRSWYGAAIEGR